MAPEENAVVTPDSVLSTDISSSDEVSTISEGSNSGSCMVEVKTNAAKFAETLRHSTTTPIAALTDILDNSVDAGASVIHITTDWKKQPKVKKTNHPQDRRGPNKIIISDNGLGMDREQLIEAFKLGANSAKESCSDLGCFGIGLKQSALRVCRKFTVITRSGSGHILVGIYDLEHIKQVNRFEVDIHEADFLETRMFEGELEKMNKNTTDVVVLNDSSGTIIILEDIDRFVWRNEKSFLENIKEPQNSGSRKTDACFGEVFRVYIDNENIRILVNNEIIQAYDPIRSHRLICPLAEESIETEYGTMYFTIAELYTESTKYSLDHGMGFYTRGFYVMRNDRQIMRGQDLGILPNKNNMNNLRIEMNFSSDIDSKTGRRLMDLAMSVSNDKCSIEIDENLKAKIKSLIAPYMKRVEKNNLDKTKAKKEEKLNTKEAERKISQKSHLLKPIKGQKEKREEQQKKRGKKRNPTGETKRRVPKKVQRAYIGKEQAIFVSADLGKKGPLFGDPEWTNDNKVKVSLNRQHPCYNFICEAGIIDVENPMLLMGYAWSREELRANDLNNDATFDVISQFRYDVGGAMATLMS